jgi:putative ABC transport system ATP-binding protein
MLVARNIVKRFGPETAAPALSGVSLAVEAGDFACIVGRSGSGKSTLLNVLSSLLKPDAGEVLYKGASVTAMREADLNRLRGTDFAMIFQLHYLLPYLTALENVLTPFMKGLSPVSRENRERGLACLERVGLADKGRRLPGELSGGEQQRVAIARALAAGPSILFADEPTGSLDKRTGQTIMDLLADLNDAGLTVVMVTHDPQFAGLASRRIELEDGRVLGCEAAVAG